MRGITKKGQESPIKRHTCEFLIFIFPNLRHSERYTLPPLTECVVGVLSREKVISSLKKSALRANIAHSNWLN